MQKDELNKTNEVLEKEKVAPENTCCPTCSVRYESLLQELAIYKEMLERLQFVKDKGRVGSALYTFCPICGYANIRGHANISRHSEDCELNKLLRKE